MKAIQPPSAADHQRNRFQITSILTL